MSGWDQLRLAAQTRSVPLAGHSISVSGAPVQVVRQAFSSTYNGPLLAAGLRIPKCDFKLLQGSRPCSEN
jgi:hypothetical protein